MDEIGRLAPKETIEIDLGDVAPLKAEIARLTAQRDRLRKALESLDAEFLLFAGGAPRAWYRIEQDASLGLQPGDMGDMGDMK